MKTSDLRPVMEIRLDSKLYVCVQAARVTPGNLRPSVHAKLRSLAGGIMLEKRLRSTEELDQGSLDRREMEYSIPITHVTVSNEMFGNAIKISSTILRWQ